MRSNAPVLIALLLSQLAAADPVELSMLNLDYSQFQGPARGEFVSAPKEQLDLNVNIDVLKYGFINNQIHSLTDQSQFRLIGWHYTLGVHLIPNWIDIYADHFSQHYLDRDNGAYPMENRIGATFYIYRRDR